MPSILNATTTSGLVTSADNSGSLQLQTNNGTTAVTIDTSQNVGIGTSSPASKLHAYGSGQIVTIESSTDLAAAGASGYLRFKGSNGNSAYIGFGGTANSYTISNGLASGFLTFETGGGTEQMRIDSSGNLLFNSGYGSVATAYGCRAWVNFNSTGTPAIRASGNVSSITDNGTGLFTANFTNAMPDGNYTSNITTRYTGSGDTLMACIQGTSYSTTSISARIMNSSFNLADSTEVSIAIFR